MSKLHVSTLKENMSEKASLEFRLRKIVKKYQKTCKYLIYVVHFVILVSRVTGCIYISAFVSLACVPVSFKSYAVVIKLCAIISGIIKYNKKAEKAW